MVEKTSIPADSAGSLTFLRELRVHLVRLELHDDAAHVEDDRFVRLLRHTMRPLLNFMESKSTKLSQKKFAAFTLFCNTRISRGRGHRVDRE